MKVRSFFSVKTGKRNDIICLQANLKRVSLLNLFTAVHEDIPKCMPRGKLT